METFHVLLLVKEISKPEELLDVWDSLYPATIKFMKEVTISYFLNIILMKLKQKQPFTGVPSTRCLENMQ